MIAQPNEGVSGTPYVPDGDGAAGAWWTIEMKKLYQAYSDGTYPDYGFRLTSADSKKFNSVEAIGHGQRPLHDREL